MWGDMILVYISVHDSFRGDHQSLRDFLRSTNPGQEAMTLNFINHAFKLQYVNIILV